MKIKVSSYSLKKSTEHLLYEVWMFYQTLVLLTKPQDVVSRNILLDAFAIHTRNMFDFFYPKKPNMLKKDDMIVNDFMIDKRQFDHNKTSKRELFFIIRKADKQVAHLTYARNRYSAKNKSWHFVLIGRKFNNTLCAFYDSLAVNQQKWKKIVDLKTIIDKYSSV